MPHYKKRTCPIVEKCIVTGTTHVPYTIICFWLHQIHKQSHTYLIMFYIQIFCTSILRKKSILKRDKISLLWWKTGFWMIIWPIWYGDQPCYSGKPVTNSLTYCVFVKLIKWPQSREKHGWRTCPGGEHAPVSPTLSLNVKRVERVEIHSKRSEGSETQDNTF